MASTYVALLRGINVGGKNKLPMAELRAALTGDRIDRVSTYIQSGNIVLASTFSAAELEAQLERTLDQEFSLRIDVVVRSATQWERYLGDNPYPQEAQEAPKQTQLGLSQRPPARDAAHALQQLATRGERVRLVEDGLWIHYPNGIGESKLTSAVMDRCVGSSVTARNWRTVRKLGDMITGLGH